MKAIMYHYVRKQWKALPHFRYLHVEAFRKQLDYFEQTYGFVSQERFLGLVEGSDRPESGVVLTFDDGFIDHYEWVFPELEKRGLWDPFYVATGTYESGKSLDVHRVHYLLGRSGGRKMLDALVEVLDPEMLSHDHVEEFHKLTYKRQSNDDATLQFKRILNYFASAAQRESILDSLVERFLPETDIVRELYMTPDMLRELHDAGMILGSHSVSHPVLSKLDEAEQRREINQSFDCLDGLVGGLRIRTFCYPYGGFHSFTETTKRLLSEAGCRFSFNVEQRDLMPSDFKSRPQALPRYDCNRFPHGQVQLEAT